MSSPTQGTRVSRVPGAVWMRIGLPGVSTGGSAPCGRSMPTSMRCATHVRIVDELLVAQARTRGDAGGAELRTGLAPASCRDAHCSMAGRMHVLEMVDPALPVGQARVGPPFGVADDLGQALEVVLAGHLDDEPAVAGPEPVIDERAQCRRS